MWRNFMMKKAIVVFLATLILCIALPEAVAKNEDNGEKSVVVIVTAAGEVDDAIHAVTTLLPSSKLRKTYNHVFNGFSLELSKHDVQALQQLDEVERVDEVSIYQAALDESVPFIGGDQLRGKLDRNGERLTGKGVKVAVIDTGIDYRHPDLRKNYKGGYDVVDYDHDPMETMPSQGPSTLHGTHVAGIIAANGKVKGVAPDAELYAYRALGPGGQGTTEQIIEAIDKAIDDGADIINLSLGNTVNGPDWPTSLALDRTVEKGIVAVTSNGNSGPKMWTVGSPGTSTKAISVGASSPPLKTPYVTVVGDKRELTLFPFGGARPWDLKRDYEFIDVGYGLEEDWEGVDAKEKIVLIERGLIPFSEKIRLAKEAGAKAVIIYNNLPGEFVGAIEQEEQIAAVTISKEDGDWLKEKLSSAKKAAYIRTIYRKEEDLIAPFSSRGPVTVTWEVKPDLVAPGVAIDSTVPQERYLGLNGTSMSAPHVAGAAALLLQAHPDWSPEQVKAALMNTAKKLYDQNGEPYLPYEQGAGRLQIDRAVSAKTLVYPGAVTFGKWSKDDLREKRKATFMIENHDDVTRTYHVNPPFDLPDGLQWEVPFGTALAPGEKKEVTVELDLLPAVLEEGIHYGDIVIEGGKDVITVPYVFFIEEPDYPRVMAFNFGLGDAPGKYRYELYLPGGADEMTIALYDPDTFEFIRLLDERHNIGRGLVGGEWSEKEVPPGTYKALIYASKDGKKDTIEKMIVIPKG